MSYDVFLSHACCADHEHDERSVWASFNGIDIGDWSGRMTNEILADLRQAIDTMTANLPEYAALNPANGWGDARTLLDDFLIPMRDAIVAHGEVPLLVTVSR